MKFRRQPWGNHSLRSSVQSVVHHHTTKLTERQRGKPDCQTPNAEWSRTPATEELRSTLHRQGDYWVLVVKRWHYNENLLHQRCHCGSVLPSFYLRSYLWRCTIVAHCWSLRLYCLYLILQDKNTQTDTMQHYVRCHVTVKMPGNSLALLLAILTTGVLTAPIKCQVL